MDRTQHHLESVAPCLVGYIPQATRQLLKLALEEDLGQGDILGEAISAVLGKQASQPVTLQVVPRQACMVSGTRAVQVLIQESGLNVTYTPLKADGMPAFAKEPMGTLSGSLVEVLALERTVLNLLQRLCGIATHTHRFVQTVAGTGVRIAHTRKTTPGWRYLEQQAVLHGGGFAHRYNLSHTAMVKDNALAMMEVPIQTLLDAIRHRLPHTAKLEVECDTLEQIPIALEAGATVLLLDNMNPPEIKQAVEFIAGRAVVEISGGITLENISAYALSGVDVISTSQITIAAPPIDIGLDACTAPSFNPIPAK